MSEVKILDGGFSTQLTTHVGPNVDGDPLWTARFLVTNPEAVFATHLDFLRAGADIIQTNTYQASITGFVQYLGISKEESLQLIYNAVDLTKGAVETYLEEIKGNANVVNPKPQIVGSCGPYGASLHDASEYTGSYAKDVTAEFLAHWHKPRIEALVKGGVDLLALETIPCKLEAEALIDLLKRDFPSTKAWLSFSCRADGKSLADGSNFQEVALGCYKKALVNQLIAVGVNCLAPRAITPLIKGINNKSSTNRIPLVIYPNSGEKYSVQEGWKKEDEWYPLEQFIDEWLDLGVTYIGGCCRTYAKDIISIREHVRIWQSKVNTSKP
ncbi:homocysteine S-methyltransferase 1-like [Cephus cinctus]|uniref:Homocysteine S-methyltransferase 1-like n=1 Tax=Cephus cinctus TaxID=211228 RepID=A0AAJ7W5Z9_CEPCN|nr:homocysteine S-methyltransferase 1-like [Cephus cinctus]